MPRGYPLRTGPSLGCDTGVFTRWSVPSNAPAEAGNWGHRQLAGWMGAASPELYRAPLPALGCYGPDNHNLGWQSYALHLMVLNVVALRPPLSSLDTCLAVHCTNWVQEHCVGPRPLLSPSPLWAACLPGRQLMRCTLA